MMTETYPRKPVRLWPGIVIVALQWLARFVLPGIWPEITPYAIIGSLLCAIAIAVWWLFFSRAPWMERLGAIAVAGVALFATSRIAHESIQTGAQGMLLPILAIPFLSLALVVWAAAARHLPERARLATMTATIVLACGVWALVRTGGFSGDFRNDLQWRWAKSPEERLMARVEARSELPPPPAEKAPAVLVAPEPVASAARITVKKLPEAVPPAPAKVAAMAEWTGFRGPTRNSVIPGVRLATDWSASPPVELWRRAVGPGWSSFAVRDGLIYTQEQRGSEEVVSCYRLATGEPVWAHRDTARFWESNAGAGPRSTPSLGKNRVYTFGATGILNALAISDGSVIWSRNAATDTETKVPDWGFASSPLLFDDLVIVAVSGQLAAYDAAAGTPKWVGPKNGTSYSSPQLSTANGVPQVLLLSKTGITSVAPADGKVLWEHHWEGYPIVQPALLTGGDVLISVNESSGTRRLTITPASDTWQVQERWTTNGLKPYFNDFVIHKGHGFGFDGGILACINLDDGKRKWKGGRYGHGQMILLADQDVLIVLSEEGEFALVRATPEQFEEVARFKAIEGKTWNHPVLADDVLLARNAEEMAAFRVSLVRR